MGTELVKADPGALAVQQEPTSILGVIAAAAADPRVDVGKMQALLAMKMQLDARDAETAYKAAMAELQAEMPRVTKEGRIEVKGELRSTYARYEDIDRAVRPLLAKHGFSVEFDASLTERGMEIKCIMSHRQGHSKTSSLPLKMDDSGSKQGPQCNGATVTYGKRYLLGMVLNIITVGADTDGASATPISDEQAMSIYDMLDAHKLDREKFLGWAKVTKIEDIPAHRFEDAMRALKAAAARKGGGK